MSLFREFAPYSGSKVYLESDGNLIPIAKNYSPRDKDAIVIVVTRPEKNITALDLGKILESGTIEDSQPAGGALLGGWTVDRDSYLEVPDGVMHLAQQTVAGTNHCVLCKGWKLCFAAVTVQKTEIVKTVPLDVAALSQRPAE